MQNPYAHLLSPLKVGNTVLRNRMITGPSMAHFIQGPETYPSQTMIEYFAEKARSGAAVVTVGCALPKKRFEETAHAAKFEYTNLQAQNYISQLTEAIHFHGAKASLLLDPADVVGLDVSEGVPAMRPKGAGFQVVTGDEITREQLEEMVEEYAQQALIAKQCGFDMVFLHSAYRFFLISRFLSPLTNHRTDEFGGSLENRARFLMMICARIKELCGKDFLIEISISGEEPEGGITLEDVIAWTKMLEGYVDIMQIRAGEIDPNHPTGYDPHVTPFLNYAAAIKASNPPMAIATIGGFQDPTVCENAVAQGKTDLIAAARAWISNSDYGKKIYEGRAEDVVPCIRCNKCHIPSRGCTFNSICSVNPTWGSIAPQLDKNVQPPKKQCNVAVIGGGPAGMKAALVSSERGHTVTLFEKESNLGGQLRHADFASFKWPLRNFKKFLVRKVEENEHITVHLNTTIAPDDLRGKGYDHIIVALGPTPIAPPIEGIEAVQTHFAEEIFSYNRHEELAEDIVVIGGGEIGVETGLYFAEKGHKTFVLEMSSALCIDATPVHYRAMVEEYWEAEKNFSYAVNATCTKVTPEGVYYLDADGTEQFKAAGSIVIAAGMRPQPDLAMSFFGIDAAQTTVIGDCDKPGSVQLAMRTAFAAGVKL